MCQDLAERMARQYLVLDREREDAFPLYFEDMMIGAVQSYIANLLVLEAEIHCFDFSHLFLNQIIIFSAKVVFMGVPGTLYIRKYAVPSLGGGGVY
jgi:hypothetical protein